MESMQTDVVLGTTAMYIATLMVDSIFQCRARANRNLVLTRMSTGLQFSVKQVGASGFIRETFAFEKYITLIIL